MEAVAARMGSELATTATALAICEPCGSYLTSAHASSVTPTMGGNAA